MALSGSLENGLLLTANPDANIIIGISGRLDIIPNFYMEYGNIVYRFGPNLKCSFWGKTIEYTGMLAPTTPDNNDIFQLIYPRFA